MKELSRVNGYYSVTYVLDLTPEEAAKPPGWLITSADRKRPITDEEWDAIAKDNIHPGHFGGQTNVFQRPDGTWEGLITVYID